MKKEKLLEKVELMKGLKNKRLHVLATSETADRIKAYAENFEMTMSEIIIYSALSFQIKDISNKLNQTLRLLGLSYELNKEKTKKEANKYRGYKGEQMKKKSLVKNAQFHLRITQDAYDEIKRKAEIFGMTISDYISFVTLHFDLMEISEKIDLINDKLTKTNP